MRAAFPTLPNLEPGTWNWNLKSRRGRAERVGNGRRRGSNPGCAGAGRTDPAAVMCPTKWPASEYAGAVEAAHAHHTEFGQIDGTGSGVRATRLSRNRLLRRIERAGPTSRVRRRPQSGANRELATLRATNHPHHLARVLAYALASESVTAPFGFIEGERPGGPGFATHAANEFDGTARGRGAGRSRRGLRGCCGHQHDAGQKRQC